MAGHRWIAGAGHSADESTVESMVVCSLIICSPLGGHSNNEFAGDSQKSSAAYLTIITAYFILLLAVDINKER
jgi:hypothetical protein